MYPSDRIRSAVPLASWNRPSPLAITKRTWLRGRGPPGTVVVGAAVVVGGSVVVGAAVVGATEVDTGTDVGTAIVVATTGSDVEVAEVPTDVDGADSATLIPGSSTNGSLGTGRPAMAKPARPPTTITTRANGHDLRIRQSSYRRTPDVDSATSGGTDASATRRGDFDVRVHGVRAVGNR